MRGAVSQGDASRRAGGLLGYERHSDYSYLESGIFMAKESNVKQQYRDVLPILLGGDTGVYGIARSFHEAFGVKSICVNRSPIDAIRYSSIFQVEHVSHDVTPEELIAVVNGVAAAHPQRRPVIMANHDTHSALIAAYRDRLDPRIAVPFPTSEAIARVTDKAHFTQVCEGLGIATPGTVVADFAHGVPDVHVPFDFPVVAKAARGDAYDAVKFPGKRKIWFIHTLEELNTLWQTLDQAGFKDRFLVQELIPGDNTCMRSVTAYVDSHDQVTLIGSARVLLEDHAPTMIGNPVGMITMPLPDLWEDAVRILTTTGYRGFANFDIKIDPRTDRAVFFEVNPRIGRNNWYMTQAGVNPMIPMVKDLLDGQCLKRQELENNVLYSLVPDRLLLHYLRDEDLKNYVTDLIKQGKREDLMRYPADLGLHRRAVVLAQKLNHYRKFKRFYPEATDRSF